MKIQFRMLVALVNLALAHLLLCLSACAPNGTKRNVKDWRDANIHKVVVVCLQGDQQADQRIETKMVPILRHQGLDAIASQDLFPAGSKYSPKSLMDQMRRAQVDGIMELTYSGKVPNQDLPQGIRFKYHSIKGQTAKLPDRLSSLEAAFIELIAGPAK